jgi:hypothetical protein
MRSLTIELPFIGSDSSKNVCYLYAYVSLAVEKGQKRKKKRKKNQYANSSNVNATTLVRLPF